MLARSIVFTLLFTILIVDAALPRLRPAKKAMRNSLVRFGKRGDVSDNVFLGESFGPGETDGLYFEREQPKIPVQYSYY
ncbi:hypothetical protein RB195_021848 [Necator americanus]|uniref:Uncharacterized protein n=2 Tax=Necator americanus TaxID=51031 RepID=W2TPA9_NECAM|nr:hypothetical protein NECAME_07322 [Necator americanus]ETN83613.1 hypothetical protein NECAME_07322 [Necator americanus]